MTDLKKEIRDLATKLETGCKRRKYFKKKIYRETPYVRVDQMEKLITINEAVERRLLIGSLDLLQKKARKKEIKAIKIGGRQSWYVLPEWIEEYNNGFYKSHG